MMTCCFDTSGSGVFGFRGATVSASTAGVSSACETFLAFLPLEGSEDVFGWEGWDGTLLSLLEKGI